MLQYFAEKDCRMIVEYYFYFDRKRKHCITVLIVKSNFSLTHLSLYKSKHLNRKHTENTEVRYREWLGKDVKPMKWCFLHILHCKSKKNCILKCLKLANMNISIVL